MEYVQKYTKWQLQRSQNYPKHPNGGPLRPPKGYFAKFGFFEAATLYIFGHIPTNAYAILAAIVQQEFKHPKFKHPNEIPDHPFSHGGSFLLFLLFLADFGDIGAMIILFGSALSAKGPK